MIQKPSTVIFANDKIEQEFLNLKDSDDLKKNLTRAIKEIQENAFCGIQIPKRLIPKEWAQMYGFTNLWKYDLPDGWRLIYSIITPNKIEIVTIILEWFDHKNYERRFGY
jgi:Txe/YoeB family toxin of Txe-Axe toxin-antitoxin module